MKNMLQRKWMASIVAILFLSLSVQAQYCLPDYSYIGTYNGHYYYLSDAGYHPSDAYLKAANDGGYLASITSAEENAWLSPKVPGYITIGLNDLALEGNWVWDSGEPATYFNWWFGEPNNVGNEDYVVTNFRANGRWNDIPNGVMPLFIIEFEEAVTFDDDGDGIGNLCDDCPTAWNNIPHLDPQTCNCEPGYYQETQEINGETVITGCQVCPIGFYCPDGIDAFPCAPGFVQPVEGAIFCIPCIAGYYQSDEGQAACDACPVGKFSATEGAVFCESCPMGTYQNMTAQTECINCPPGKFSDIIGAFECQNCLPGTYQSESGAKHCVNCPPGAYQGNSGAIVCELCPVATYNPVEGAAFCQNCDMDYNSNIGSTECFPDVDGDFVADADDNCPDVANPNQEDDDEDGVGNGCDNCPLVVNGDQADNDGDGLGDACDPDDDNDGCLDEDDANPFVASGDADCDGVADDCDVCAGGDDNIDANEDGFPDCSQNLNYNDYSSDWKCAKNKISICHNGNTLCISKNALNAHYNHGDVVGPCTNCAEENNGVVNIPPHQEKVIYGLAIFPNPASQEVTIQVRESTLPTFVSMTDHLGRLIWSGTFQPGEINQKLSFGQMSISEGLYTITAQSNGEYFTQRLIIVK